jgi:gluconokinase
VPQQHAPRPDGAVLALDLGTSSVRAVVLERDGSGRGGQPARRRVELRVSRDGAAELDPAAYTDALVACIDDLQSQQRLNGVTAVVTSSQWHSIVALDATGQPTSGVLTWADTRGRRPRLPAERMAALHRRTGAWPHAQYWTGRIPWLLEQTTGTARFAGLAELMTQRLLGDASASLSIASGTGLLDTSAGGWDAEALDVAQASTALLPELQPHDWRGRLLPGYQRRWPALATASWYAAVGDGAAANFGTGCVDSTSINVTVGTSAAVRLVEQRSPAAALPDSLWRYLADPRRTVSGVAFSSGGGVFEWTRKVVGVPLDGSDPPGLAEVPAGSEGVIALPFQAGARPPRDVATASGAFAGLGLASTRYHLLSAVMESVCFELAEAVEAIEEYAARVNVIVASGGALEASALWRSRLAATLGRAIRFTHVPEASARGTVRVHFDDFVSAEDGVDIIEPDAFDVETLRAARARYRRLREQHQLPPVSSGAH